MKTQGTNTYKDSREKGARWKWFDDSAPGAEGCSMAELHHLEEVVEGSLRRLEEEGLEEIAWG